MHNMHYLHKHFGTHTLWHSYSKYIKGIELENTKINYFCYRSQHGRKGLRDLQSGKRIFNTSAPEPTAPGFTAS